MPPDELTKADALGSAAAWDGEEAPTFKPVSVRRYFPNRALFRTRGSRRTLRTLKPVARTRVCARGPRRPRVTSGPRKARAPDDDGSLGDVGEPEEPSGCSPSPGQADRLDALALSPSVRV
jgi:hypothetical protein